MTIEHLLPYVPQQVPAETLPQPEATPVVPKDGPHIRIYSSAERTDGEQVKWAAQRLHTDVYLDEGFITEEDINPFGLYIDEYVDRSTYFYVANGHKVAAARQIHATRKEGIMSLPTARHFGIDPDVVSDAAQVRSVADIKPRDVVEISGLASRRTEDGKSGYLDAVRSLYSQLLRNSLEKGHKLWLMNVDPKFMRVMGHLVGPEQVRVLGEKRQYMGPATVPVAINPQEVVRKILGSTDPSDDAHKAHLCAVFAGINDRRIPKGIRLLLSQNGIPRKQYPESLRLATNPKVVAQAAIMGYSALRALPANSVNEFHGSVAALWGVDVATSIPYAYGMTEMFFGKSLGRKLLGATIAIPTFLAPYAYFYAEGEGYPKFVNAAVAGFVGAAATKELVSRHLRQNKEERICRGLASRPGREIVHHTA